MRSPGNFNPEWGYLAPAPSFMRTARVVLVATAIGATAGAAVVISLIDRPTSDSDKTASITAHAIVTSVQAAPAMATPPVTAAAVAVPVKTTTGESAAASPAAVAPQPLPQAAPPIASQVAPQPPAAPAGEPVKATISEPEMIAPAPVAPPTLPQVTPPIASQFAAQPPAVPAAQPVAIAPPQARPENSAAGDASVAAPKHSAGMAALSEASPASETVHPAEASDQALLPPETVPPEKKTKHHVANSYAANSKYKPAPSLGTVLRRIFNPHTGTSYYPNR